MEKNKEETYEEKRKRKNKQFARRIIYGFVIFIGITLFFCSFYIVNAGERAVLINLGNPSMIPRAEGLHFKVPFIQSVVIMDIKTQKYEAEASAASKDLQIVTSKIVTNYHLDSNSIPRLYKEVGTDYSSRLIQPMEQEVVKATTAKFTAEELITKREEVRLDIKSVLHERLMERGIIVEEVSITNFDFSPEFNKAIEAKVTAEQNALAEKNNLAKIEYQAQQRITQAKGEAEAIKIQVQAVQQQGGADYVKLQAIQKWNGVMPYVTGGNSLPFIDIPIGGNQSN